jgi:4-hydroxy-3-polyprenylbenzoate decarboxylase
MFTGIVTDIGEVLETHLEGDLRARIATHYDVTGIDIGASIASGSFRTAGMLVAPCSVKTLSGIANCFSDDLVTRAADVQLKERRRVVLLFRETPLHAGHIELMGRATASGAILMPPVPAFYAGITSLDEAVTQTVGRALDLLGIDAGVVHRWHGQAENDGTS